MRAIHSTTLRQIFSPFALALLLINSDARAECECLWQGSFSEVQASTPLVVSATVLSRKGNSIDLEVETVLRGESSPEIRVWLKTKNYCRPKAELFPPRSRWVMALHRIESAPPDGFNPSTPNISYGRIGDYSLSSCGGYWLSLTENLVSGNLVNAPRWAREPIMTPVLLDLLAAYVAGEVDVRALLEASREDPDLRELMLDTKAFLRQ